MARYKLENPGDFAVLRNAVCAMGVFDGVHVGHRFLIDEARRAADKAGARMVALTFDIDPDELFRPEAHRKLVSNEARLALLEESGADDVAILPFTRAFAALSPQAFLETCFADHCPAQLHVGSDFHFGAKAAGTVDVLEVWGSAHGMTVCAYALREVDGAPVTATRIRTLLGEGRVAAANALLGRPYALEGAVEAGRGEGREFGIRTANVHVNENVRALADGVYAAYAFVDGARYKAAVNIGVPATFADRTTATCEAHILDFNGDLYGQVLRLEFIEWLRPMRVFANTEELIATITANITWVRENL